MSSGLASLHKILKDETRSKTILLLSEKGELSYTDLMDELGIVSTGLMNYHLKVLGDLLRKNEAGRYMLSDRGKLAAKLLVEFPDENNQLAKKRRQRIFWTIAGTGQIMIFVTVLVLYLAGSVDFSRLVQTTVAAIFGVALAFLGYRMWSNRPESGSREEKFRMKIGYIIGGAWLVFFIGFFGPVLLTLVSMRLGGPNIFRLIDATIGATLYFLLLLFVLMPIGGIGGYYLGKRNNFNKPRWATWVDEKFGFY